MATKFYGNNEGLFADSSSLGGGGSCPAASPASPDSCQGSVDTCWSPGQPDADCPGFGLCCFDGCSNTCPGGEFYSRVSIEEQNFRFGYFYLKQNVCTG